VSWTTEGRSRQICAKEDEEESLRDPVQTFLEMCPVSKDDSFDINHCRNLSGRSSGFDRLRRKSEPKVARLTSASLRTRTGIALVKYESELISRQRGLWREKSALTKT
jgi:hypothetical protein